MSDQSDSKLNKPETIGSEGFAGLERIETASRDEIAGLQLERMKRSLQQA